MKINSANTRQSIIEFPVSVGDTVYSMVEDEEHRVEIIPYSVKGLAYVNGKKYVIDCDGDLNEIGTKFCILPQHVREGGPKC